MPKISWLTTRMLTYHHYHQWLPVVWVAIGNVLVPVVYVSSCCFKMFLMCLHINAYHILYDLNVCDACIFSLAQTIAYPQGGLNEVIGDGGGFRDWLAVFVRINPGTNPTKTNLESKTLSLIHTLKYRSLLLRVSKQWLSVGVGSTMLDPTSSTVPQLPPSAMTVSWLQTWCVGLESPREHLKATSHNKAAMCSSYNNLGPHKWSSSWGDRLDGWSFWSLKRWLEIDVCIPIFCAKSGLSIFDALGVWTAECYGL